MPPVHIIGVSLDLGGNRRGVDMGPSAFRIGGLAERLTALGITVVDEGDLVAPIPEIKSLGDPSKKYIREIARVVQKLYKAALGDVAPKVTPDHTVLIGIRNLDEREKELMRGSGVRVFTMKDIDRSGIAAIVEQALAIAGTATAGIHVSFDMDVCDPTIAPGVG